MKTTVEAIITAYHKLSRRLAAEEAGLLFPPVAGRIRIFTAQSYQKQWQVLDPWQLGWMSLGLRPVVGQRQFRVQIFGFLAQLAAALGC